MARIHQPIVDSLRIKGNIRGAGGFHVVSRKPKQSPENTNIHGHPWTSVDPLEPVRTCPYIANWEGPGFDTAANQLATSSWFAV